MKWQFQLEFYQRARLDERIFLIIGDVGGGLFKKFRQDFPKRFLNAGLCEQSMVSFAAGLAIKGFRPVVYSITPFLIERAFEQIKLDVAQQNLPVGLVGSPYDGAGPTHTAVNSLVMMSQFKNIQIMQPRGKDELTFAIAGFDENRPWFLELKTL